MDSTMRHPLIFRWADYWIHTLGPMGAGVRRPRWLNRVQMWAGMSDYQHDVMKGVNCR